MRNSIISRRSFSGPGERRSWLATAFLAVLLSLGFGVVNAYGQDAQDAPPAPAQQPGPGMGRGMGRRPMESVDDQIKHLSKKLNLTDDQQAKLKPILEDQRKQMEQIHGDSSLSREDRFSKMQALRQSSDTQIKGVLCSGFGGGERYFDVWLRQGAVKRDVPVRVVFASESF